MKTTKKFKEDITFLLFLVLFIFALIGLWSISVWLTSGPSLFFIILSIALIYSNRERIRRDTKSLRKRWFK